ncbi:nucleotidyltransferase family protein [Plantactinospora endophytica]|uniref:4-diphosphocytidyl-2C-methyl-D-erythritol synthase n=1 Tax=Plantactinospora endophytica TaxID=673535 RepID=A0ABQ4EEH7_9ACTN|nr:NTP transferase domain-containing protein [Plantactinospora endophytica]GIG92642.1 4-diphosphocytidyl-2C-methyl-D-erythritol synthase [Plantactinospora endophytica]
MTHVSPSIGPPGPAPVAGLVLAGGAGRRYGGPKALVRRDGRLLVDRAVQVARDGGCAPVVAVLGAAAAEILRQAEFGDAVPVENPDWATGMGSSLRTGLAALHDSAAVAALVLLVDMPGITAEAVRRLVELAAPDALAMAGYGTRRGHPVLLGRAHWPGVAELAVGDVGARPYLRRHAAGLQVVPCDDVADDADLDVPPTAAG